MQPFGSTRTRIGARHAFIAPDGHVEAALPGWRDSQGVIFISPQLGSGTSARFGHYLARMAAGGHSAPPLPGIERFLYLLDGRVTLEADGREATLGPGGYAYLPPGAAHTVHALEESRLNLFEKRYLPLSGHPAPDIVIGSIEQVPGEPFLGDPDVRVQQLLPADPAFDLAVNIMNFAPGAALPFVETHVMEHGLYMLAGGGIYRLEDDWYPIAQGDVLWMGPYCPQWFGALGKTTSSYLLYKDWNRDPLALEGALRSRALEGALGPLAPEGAS